MKEDVHAEPQSHLSALMDGEVGEFELRRILALMEQEPGLRDKWRRYQLAASALRGEAVDRRVDLSARIADALADTPTPRPRILVGLVGRAAIAASVAVLTVAGVRHWLPFEGSGQQQVAVQTAAPRAVDEMPYRPVAQRPYAGQIPAVRVVSAVDGSALPVEVADGAQAAGLPPAQEQQVRAYLEEQMLRHAEAAAGDNRGLAPFARAPRRVEEP
jgi:sigma-E factor negative regulatory protein RseA